MLLTLFPVPIVVCKGEFLCPELWLLKLQSCDYFFKYSSSVRDCNFIIGNYVSYHNYGPLVQPFVFSRVVFFTEFDGGLI